MIAFIYTISSYRIMCLIQRAAIGEVLGLCFLPLLLVGMYNLFKGDRRKWYQVMIGATGVFQSHMIGTLLSLSVGICLLIIYMPIVFKEKRWGTINKTVIVTLLLNLWYIVPFLDFYSLDLVIHHEAEHVSGFANHVIIPTQLFDMLSDRFGYSNPLTSGITNEMSMTLGIAISTMLIFCTVVFIKYKSKRKGFKLYIYIIGVIMLLSSTSLIPWKKLQEMALINKIASIIQFPWRLLGFFSTIILIVNGMLLKDYYKNWTKKTYVSIFLIVLLFGTLAYLPFGKAATEQPVYLEKIEALDKEALKSTVGMSWEYFINGTDRFDFVGEDYRVSDDLIQIWDYEKDGTNIKVIYASDVLEGYIEVPLLWYPGYEAYDEKGNSLEIQRGHNNVIQVILPQTLGEGVIFICYKGKFIYHVGEVISLVTIIALIGYYARRFHKRLILQN